MRVTNKMIGDRVVFNLQRSMRRFLDLQTNISTGRRINQPSDDPVGTVRDLNYRSELSNIAQWQGNISQATNWTNNYDTILGDLKDFVSNAREIAVAMANGTYDATSRQASASEISSVFQQMVQLANSELEGRRVFAGYVTQRTPFEISSAGISYRGDAGVIEFETEASQRTAVNLTGQEVFLKQLQTLGADADVNVGISAATLLADLNNGNGIDLAAGEFTITDKNLGITANIDLTAAPAPTTVGDLLSRINMQLAAAGILNLTASISTAGNNISFDTTENGLLSGNTLLAKLNSGNGVDMSPGQIRVSNSAGVDFTVDLSGSATITDVINSFNTQVAAQGLANVTMSVNPDGTGLIIEDTNAVPYNLSISEISDFEQTAAGLGIAGSVGSQLIGDALNPAVHFEIAETTGTTAADLGIKAVFAADYTGSDLDARLTANTMLSLLGSGLGAPSGSIKLTQGNAITEINLADPTLVTVQNLIDRINGSGLNVTASINPSGRGLQVVNNDTTRSFTISEVGTGRAAKALHLYGSSDIMGTMQLLTTALQTDDQEGTGMLIGGLDTSIEQLLNYRALVGARAIRLASTANRLTDMELNFTKLLSDVEDIDLPSALTQLSTLENGYRSALMATSSIIQPTLLDFLD